MLDSILDRFLSILPSNLRGKRRSANQGFRSYVGSWSQDGPRALQEGLRDRFWSDFQWFSTVFRWFFDPLELLWHGFFLPWTIMIIMKHMCQMNNNEPYESYEPYVNYDEPYETWCLMNHMNHMNRDNWWIIWTMNHDEPYEPYETCEPCEPWWTIWTI